MTMITNHIIDQYHLSNPDEDGCYTLVLKHNKLQYSTRLVYRSCEETNADLFEWFSLGDAICVIEFGRYLFR